MQTAGAAGFRSSTDDAVEAIGEIANTMEEVSEFTSSIASAFQEQGSATSEISQNAGHAAQGTQDVVEKMTGVRPAVEETTQSAIRVLGASREVADQAAMLRTEVDHFLDEVAAA